MTLAIGDGGDIPVIVIGVGLGVEERIFSRPRPVHVVVRVDRLLALGIGDGQEIAVGVIGGSAIDLIQRETFVAP